MDEKFYTIDQVAEIIGIHHKTVRKFISEGKLKASKIGKQWRITGYDLNNFMESKDADVKNEVKKEMDPIEFSTVDIDKRNTMNKISISTVVDITDLDAEEYRRISNTLLAVMNSNDAIMKDSTINIKYYPKEKNIKIILWGSVQFMKEILDLVTLLTENNPNSTVNES